jgi:hypothetical protein
MKPKRKLKIVEDFKWVSVNWLKLGKEYQRDIESPRLKKVEKGMSKYGFWPHKPIAAFEDGSILDGQHRLIIARKLGIKKVPVTIYRSMKLEKEAELFSDDNSHSTNLKCTDMINADRLAKDPAALIIYKLEEDPHSKLKGRITLKNKRTGIRDRFSIGAVISLINTVVFGRNALHWKKDSHRKLADEIEEKGYEHILSRVNLFLTWFYAFAENKQANPFAYRLKTFRALLRVYLSLEKQGFLSTPAKWQKTVDQMRKFNFSEYGFNKSEWTSRAMLLRDHINKNRKHKLEM